VRRRGRVEIVDLDAFLFQDLNEMVMLLDGFLVIGELGNPIPCQVLDYVRTKLIAMLVDHDNPEFSNLALGSPFFVPQKLQFFEIARAYWMRWLTFFQLRTDSVHK
jgi:hypothetical protein